MTGTGHSEQRRPLPPPEVARRPTGRTHTDSTEADSPPLTCCPEYRLSTTAALALSSLTKVIVRFVFGLFLHWTLYERTNWELKIGTVFWDLTVNSVPPPLLCHTNQPPIHPTNQPAKVAFRWVRDEKLAFVFCSFSFEFLFILLYCFSLTLFYPPLAFFAMLMVKFLTVWE